MNFNLKNLIIQPTWHFISREAKKHCLPLKKIKFRFLVLTPDDVIKTQDQRNVRNLLPGNATFV